MNHLNIQFSIEEVERLCQLYIDCQLSVLEEAELEYVLRHCHFASTIINETKDLMAISRTLKLKAAKQHKGFFALPLRVAACVAMALGIYITYNHLSLNHNNDNCIVYVAGEKVNSKMAHKIAEADVAKMKKFMEAVDEHQAHEKAKVEQFMNQINHSK